MNQSQRVPFRTKLGKVTKQIPFLHRFMVMSYHIAILELWPRLRRIFNPVKSASAPAGNLNSFLSLQSIRRLRLNIETPGNDGELIETLRRLNIPLCEGGWTVYLPPSYALSTVMPDLHAYPVMSGVKILRQLKPPQQASYTPNELRPTPGATAVRSRTPKPEELLRIAGHISEAGLGPVVHDLVELVIGETHCTAFITEHIDSDSTVSESEYNEFIGSLDKLIQQGALEVTHGDYRLSKDFRSPDCNGNLLRQSNGQCLYVDFQSFRFRDEAAGFHSWSKQYASNLLFGPRRLGKESDYLYQMVPGIGDAKRETGVRWEALDSLVRRGGISFEDRCTFDIGCNSGLMSYYALSKGANWAFGWDQPGVAEASQKLLRILGGSRWWAFGTAINESTDFVSSLPEHFVTDSRGILLYLAISNHIGFPPGVSELPWQYCIYEGHSNQSIETSIEKIRTSGWMTDFEVLATGLVQDGDSPERSLILFKR